jgi:hypothetical protein
MKTRLVALVAVLGVLAILAMAFPVGVTHASIDREVQFQGAIMKLPATAGWLGAWKVGSHLVRVNYATHIDQTDGKVKLGAQVQVEGYFLKDGSIRATSIDVLPSQPGS